MPKMERSRWSLLAVALFAVLAEGCVSVNPWRDCKLPCGQAEIRKARAVQICQTNGVPLRLDHAKWGHDERGDYLTGHGQSRLGQDLGTVRVYADEMARVYTQQVEGGRVAANAALVPVVLLFSAATHQDVSSEDEDSPTHDVWQNEFEECPPPVADATPASHSQG